MVTTLRWEPPERGHELNACIWCCILPNLLLTVTLGTHGTPQNNIQRHATDFRHNVKVLPWSCPLRPDLLLPWMRHTMWKISWKWLITGNWKHFYCINASIRTWLYSYIFIAFLFSLNDAATEVKLVLSNRWLSINPTIKCATMNTKTISMPNSNEIQHTHQRTTRVVEASL